MMMMILINCNGLAVSVLSLVRRTQSKLQTISSNGSYCSITSGCCTLRLCSQLSRELKANNSEPEYCDHPTAPDNSRSGVSPECDLTPSISQHNFSHVRVLHVGRLSYGAPQAGTIQPVSCTRHISASIPAYRRKDSRVGGVRITWQTTSLLRFAHKSRMA